ncbi:Rv2732c family membrane protein [Rhodococcus sp. MEB064]|uniref:Rv2732c family membrane protein n=1 Tax=Rhodococcus sp. MEB064 TaxID=1587522 RepID=UPI0005AD133E|nr:membrane protein [Rhodococcus sp. MEB064]
MFTVSTDPTVGSDTAAAEKKISGRIDPGVRAVVVAVVVLLLLLSFALPHTGAANAWDVLVHDDDAVAESVALPSRIFVWLTLVFAVGFSALALVTQRWALAWVALYGSGVATVLGVLAIWSRQTVPATVVGAGPGIGLVLGWLLVIVLAFHWFKVVWNRSNAQWAAAAARRDAAVMDDARRENVLDTSRRPAD